MKASPKILFIKNRPDAAFARSWIVDELGMHSRIIGDAALLGRILMSEMFEVVLLDQRGSNEELIPAIEGMRQYQPSAKLVVVSDGVALSEVQQAIRFNVHDIFLPPFELHPIVERVDALFARLSGMPASAPTKLLVRWIELASTLNGALDSMFIQSDSSVGSDARDAAQPAAPPPPDLQTMLDQQTAEMTSLKADLASAVEARARLTEQVAQLSVGASAMGRAEARARSLEAELIELRKTADNAGAGGVDVGQLRDELERAQERIVELDRLNQGLLAGSAAGGGGGDSPGSNERIQELEAELADINARFEAAGQAFAAEMEQVMSREGEAMAALAAAEERERRAQSVMATAGDAFGRADESIERERAAIQEARDELEVGQNALREEQKALAQRKTKLDARARRLDALSQSFAEDLERTLQDLGPVAERAQALIMRREEIRSITGETGGA